MQNSQHLEEQDIWQVFYQRFDVQPTLHITQNKPACADLHSSVSEGFNSTKLCFVLRVEQILDPEAEIPKAAVTVFIAPKD